MVDGTAAVWAEAIEALAERVVRRPSAEVELSALGPRAGLLGAALLAWQAAGVSDFDGWARGAAP